MAKNVNANGADKADAEFEDMLKSQAAEVGAGSGRVANGIVTQTASQSSMSVEPIYAMPIEEALKSDKPEARQTVVENCMHRNRVKKPERAKKWFEVEYHAPKTRESKFVQVQANDEVDAIAVANTQLNISAGPHGRKVTLLPQVA